MKLVWLFAAAGLLVGLVVGFLAGWFLGYYAFTVFDVVG